jgi:hypothetical protein
MTRHLVVADPPRRTDALCRVAAAERIVGYVAAYLRRIAPERTWGY